MGKITTKKSTNAVAEEPSYGDRLRLKMRTLTEAQGERLEIAFAINRAIYANRILDWMIDGRKIEKGVTFDDPGQFFDAEFIPTSKTEWQIRAHAFGIRKYNEDNTGGPWGEHLKVIGDKTQMDGKIDCLGGGISAQTERVSYSRYLGTQDHDYLTSSKRNIELFRLEKLFFPEIDGQTAYNESVRVYNQVHSEAVDKFKQVCGE